jgi:hypothetical protein
MNSRAARDIPQIYNHETTVLKCEFFTHWWRSTHCLLRRNNLMRRKCLLRRGTGAVKTSSPNRIKYPRYHSGPHLLPPPE